MVVVTGVAAINQLVGRARVAGTLGKVGDRRYLPLFG
jgi:hypothetical protein